ncbi:MAG: hypothetical protein HY081_03215 [Gammaproteobacteria bacterium]|nr:hypothetical protein [Gammaproteobacteria bacterium]
MNNKIILSLPWLMRTLGVTALLFVLCVNGSGGANGSKNILPVSFVPMNPELDGDVLDKTDGSYADTPLVNDFCARWSMHFASYSVDAPACPKQQRLQQQHTRSLIIDRPLSIDHRVTRPVQALVI